MGPHHHPRTARKPRLLSSPGQHLHLARVYHRSPTPEAASRGFFISLLGLYDSPMSVQGTTGNGDELKEVLALGERLRTWGKWGADDQKGTVNRITAEHRVRAAGLVRRGAVFSLALPIRDGAGPVRPRPSGRFNPVHRITVSGDLAGSFEMGGTADYTDDLILMGCHTSTHWDALCHVYYGDRMYNDVPASSVDGSGAHRNAIGAVHQDFVARGVLLDVARHQGVRTLEPGYAIRSEELLACAAKQGVALDAGDIMLIRTGAMADVHDNDWSRFHAAPRPGLHYSVAELIAEIGIAAVAADNNAVEAGGAVKGLSNPFHMIALRDMGVSLGEFWFLEELAEDCARDHVYEFMLVAPPLRIEEGAGAPVNPVAIK